MPTNAPDSPDPPDEIVEALRVPFAPQPVSAAGSFVRATVNLKLGDVVLQTKVPVPAGPTSLRQLLPVFRAFTEAIVHAATERTHAAGESISCKNGCAACCRQLVPITIPETHMLAALVANLPEPRRTEIRSRFAAAKQKISGEGAANLLDTLTNLSVLSDQQLVSFSDTYFQQQIPCPFLENESCSIYNDRPLVCREYMVTSDPAFCSTSHSDIKGVKLPGSISRAVSLSTDTPNSPQPTPRIPLILALEWAAANPESAPATTGPQLLSQILTHLSGTMPKAITPFPSSL